MRKVLRLLFAIAFAAIAVAADRASEPHRVRSDCRARRQAWVAPMPTTAAI